MKNLHKQFVQLGRQKNMLQYKLLQLLPEIYKDGIYKKYCKTIEGYAWRFAQIPKSVVEKTLKLEKHLENKPCLKAAVAEVGINKIAMVATLATPETDSIFADKVRNMSRDAVQELSKELRVKNFGKYWTDENVNQQSFLENLDTNLTLPCQAKAKTIKLELDEEMTFLFLKFKQKIEKEKKQEISNTEVMKNLLEMPFKEQIMKVQKTINSKKSKKISGDFSEELEKAHQGNENKQSDVQTTRYIPVVQKRLALEESSHKCSYPNCNKPPEVFHHPERFAVIKNHENIKPLCRQHHEFMHNGLIENEVKEVSNWNLKFDSQIIKNDELYKKYRKKSFV